MTDPFDAEKRASENVGRTRMLVADARSILGRICDDWPQWPRETQIRWLIDHGPFSWADARDALEVIDFEDGEAR